MIVSTDRINKQRTKPNIAIPPVNDTIIIGHNPQFTTLNIGERDVDCIRLTNPKIDFLRTIFPEDSIKNSRRGTSRTKNATAIFSLITSKRTVDQTGRRRGTKYPTTTLSLAVDNDTVGNRR